LPKGKSAGFGAPTSIEGARGRARVGPLPMLNAIDAIAGSENGGRSPMAAD
jgi:hypothetical protein